MWQPNSYPDLSGAKPPVSGGVPGMSVAPAATTAAEAGMDWGVAAQQWLRNKEYYETWQKAQYQQHLQMMAAAHAAQMASCIDPSVIKNPPPPPPDIQNNTSASSSNSSKIVDLNEFKTVDKTNDTSKLLSISSCMRLNAFYLIYFKLQKKKMIPNLLRLN